MSTSGPRARVLAVLLEGPAFRCPESVGLAEEFRAAHAEVFWVQDIETGDEWLLSKLAGNMHLLCLMQSKCQQFSTQHLNSVQSPAPAMTWMILLPFLPGLLGSLHLLWKRADEVKLLEGEGQTVERDKVLPAISILFTCLTFTWLLALPLCKAMTWQLFVAALPAFVYGLFLAYLASIVEDAPKMFRGGYYGMFCFTAPMLAYLGGIPFFEVSWPLLLLDSAAGLITASGLLLLKHGSDKHRSRDSRSLDIDGEDGSRFRSRLRSAGYILFHTGNTSAAFLGLAHGQLLRRSWPFVALSLFWYLAYIWLLIILIMDPHDAGDGGLDVERTVVERTVMLLCVVCSAAYFLGMPAVAFSMARGWHCANWPALVCGLWPWPVLMLPAVLYVISLAAEFPMKLGPPDVATLAGAMEAPWAKVAVLATLSVLPVLIEVNVPALCSWAEVPNLNVKAEMSILNGSFTFHLQNTSWQMAEMPRPLWPKLEEASSNAASRKVYWVTLMLLKYLIATAIAMLFLRCTATGTGAEQLYQLVTRDEGADSSEEQREDKSASTSDGDRRFVLVVLVVAQLTLCTKLTISASLRGQLNAGSGLAWEGYDLCLTAALLWMLGQAVILRFVDWQGAYSNVDIALSTLFLVPFLGDGFDTLKDSMVASLALSSRAGWLRALGAAAMVYLWVLHLFILLPSRDTSLELELAYLAILLLKRINPDAKDHSWRVKMMGIFYKQSTPGRRWAMAVEDVPQALLAMAIASEEGFSTFTFVVNIGVPALRFTLALWFHNTVAWEVRDWLLQEAFDAWRAGRLQRAAEFAMALCRLQQAYPTEDLLKKLDPERIQAAAEQVSRKDIQHGISWLLRNFHEAIHEATVGVVAFALKHLYEDGTVLAVDLSDSGLGEEACGALGEALSRLPEVTDLEIHLEAKDLTDHGYRAFCDNLAKMPRLGKLKLNAAFDRIGCQAIVEAQAKLFSDTELVLRHDNIKRLTEDVAQIRLPYGNGRLPRLSDQSGWTLAHQAVSRDRLDVLQLLRDLGGDLEAQSWDGKTPAHVAAERGKVDALQMLKDLGCDLNKTCSTGMARLLSTPLHLAIEENQLEAVNCLIAQGVDLNRPGFCRAHALDLALDRGLTDIAELLREAGALPGPPVQLVGLEMLVPGGVPRCGAVWLTCGVPELRRGSGWFYHEICLRSHFSEPHLGWLESEEDGEYRPSPFDGRLIGWGCDYYYSGEWGYLHRRRFTEVPGMVGRWKVGDVLGFAMDLDRGEVGLSVNGQWNEEGHHMTFDVNGKKLFPAVRMMGFFTMNVDKTSWKFRPPSSEYRSWGSGVFHWDLEVSVSDSDPRQRPQ
ncbi:ASB2 [Symbiodinium microadriaticum]|nr:ASB2 [Symbiodinium microadriaticum]